MKQILALLFITSYSLYSCNEAVKVAQPERKEIKKDSLVNYTNYIDIKLAIPAKLYYHASYTMDLETGEASGIKSYFIYNNRQYETPERFSNKEEYSYEYSVFPEYSGHEHYEDVAVFPVKDTYYVLLKSPNPQCNGTYCQSYFLHVLVMDNDSILGNTVYFYNPDVDFSDLKVALSSLQVRLMDGDTLLEVIN